MYWGIEHTLMATAGAGVILFLLVVKNYAWAFNAALSGVPFWGGSMIFIVYGSDPVLANLALDISIAAAFLLLAHMHDKASTACIALAILMFSMGVVDLLVWESMIQPTMVIHETLHYAALAICLGAGLFSDYVNRINSFVRRGLWH